MKHPACLLLILFLFNTVYAQTKVTYVFIGTYTDEKPGKGIYIYRLDPKTGELNLVSNAENLVNPSFLTISPNGRFLYACTDTRQVTPGNITAFTIDSLHGKITVLNKRSSGGANPVYATVDRTGRFVITGNYTGGSVTALATDAQGLLQEPAQTIQFSDSSINRERQEKSHIHSTFFSPDCDYLYTPDLGADKIRVFRFDAANAKPLTEMDRLTAKTEPGSGPRHMAFHPNKKVAYCIEEMGGMVSVYAYDHGKLTRIQRVLSNAKTAKDYSSADIHVSPDGLFLYTSNRVENTISIFSIGLNGTINLIGHESTYGETPRNFAIDPSGRFIIVANQTGNNIIVFSRDPKKGLLKRTGKEISIPNPACIQIRDYGQ